MLNYVGNYGFNWASTVGGTNGMDLNFNVQSLYSGTSDTRARGFQLRCLSE
ncbi:hypothetical protein [uncultured Rikenella sp.]|uniref:hypothetical protein n=1 Tax=uncultured Rikenella sp. TaxID=368003 RepID=UPI0025F64E7E|nr:hypothetical protein [uncultured Rikenella sp.]